MVAFHKTAIVLGNEVDGINGKLLSHCDQVFEIQQQGSKESLNVSAAAAIALYQLTLKA